MEIVDGCYDEWIVAEGKARPFVDDGVRAQVRIPRQSPEAIKIRHGQRTSEPVCVHANVRNSNKTTDGPVKHTARNKSLDWRGWRIGWHFMDAHIEVEHFFPHRHQEAKLPLLSRVLLCDL